MLIQLNGNLIILYFGNEIQIGNCIAQMIFKKCENVSFSNVENLTFDSERGVKGFGLPGL